jgi:hypothetical protein
LITSGGDGWVSRTGSVELPAILVVWPTLENPKRPASDVERVSLRINVKDTKIWEPGTKTMGSIYWKL